MRRGRRAARIAFASCFAKWRLRFVEGEARGEDGVITPLYSRDATRFQRNVARSREIGRMAGAAPQYPHLARRVFLRDFDQGLQFAPMVSVA